MTETGKSIFPTVYSVILEEYQKAQKTLERAQTTLKNARANMKRLVNAMGELGYPILSDLGELTPE